MAWVDMRGGKSGTPPLQTNVSRPIQGRVIAVQRRLANQRFIPYDNSPQPSALPLSSNSHPVLKIPCSCDEERRCCCCSSWVGRDSFEPVDVTDSTVRRGQWRRSISRCCAGTGDVGSSNKNKEVALCCMDYREPALRARSPKRSPAQCWKKFSDSYTGTINAKLLAGNGEGKYGEPLSNERRLSGCRKYEDQLLSETNLGARDRSSVSSWWNCCSRTVTVTGGPRLGARSFSVPSGSGREKRLHFFVYTARRNFWGPLQRIATLATTHVSKQVYPACKARAEPRDASAWSAAAIHLHQGNEKAIQERYRVVHARDDVLEEFASQVRESGRGVFGYDFSQRRPSSNSRIEDGNHLSPHATLSSATNEHPLGMRSNIPIEFDSAGRHHMGMNGMSGGASRTSGVAADHAGAFLLSLFLNRVCVLLEGLTLVARLLKESGAPQERWQPQVREVVEMTLLKIIEIALLALQEPKSDSLQLFRSENGHQQQVFSGSEAADDSTGRRTGKNEEGVTRKSCPVTSETPHVVRESISVSSDRGTHVYDDSGICRKGEEDYAQRAKDGLENSSNQPVEDLELAFLPEISFLKKEVRRLEKNVEGKKRKLGRAMTRCRKVLGYATHAKKLTGEYNRRRRLLSLLEVWQIGYKSLPFCPLKRKRAHTKGDGNHFTTEPEHSLSQVPIRRLALLRGHRKRCPCLFHNEIARRDANSTVGFEGRIWKLKAGLTLKNSGFDTQPVGHADQVFHSTLRKAQKPFRSMYVPRTGHGFHVSLRQGSSREHEGAPKGSGSGVFLSDKKSAPQSSPSPRSEYLSSSSPSPSRHQRRLSVSLEGNPVVSPDRVDSGVLKKSEDFPDTQESQKELQSLLSEVGDLVEEYMEKYTEDGLPHDFSCFFDLKHIGGHSMMPPVNAAAEKENGWKHRRMLFFIESLVELVSNGDVSEEQAASFVEAIVSLVEQTKVEQCDLKIHSFTERLRKLVLLLHFSGRLKVSDVELRNLFPVTCRSCLADKAITEGIAAEKGHAEGTAETVLKNSSQSQTLLGFCSLAPPSITSISNVCQDATGDAALHSGGSIEDSALREGSKKDERDTERSVLGPISPNSTPVISSAPAEAEPDHDIHRNTAILGTTTLDCPDHVNGSPSRNEKDDAIENNDFISSRSECGHDGYPATGNSSSPVERLSVFWLHDQPDADRDWVKKGNEAVPALLLLPASASKRHGASLKEKLKGVCRIGLASVMEEEGAVDCRAKGGSVVSSAAVQWMPCYIGLLSGSACGGFPDIVSRRSDSTIDVTSLRPVPLVCFTGDQREANGGQRPAAECTEKGLDVFESDSSSRNRILADIPNVTNVQLTSRDGSDDNSAPPNFSDGYKAGSFLEKFSLLGRTSLPGILSNDSERYSVQLSRFCKPNEQESRPRVGSLISLPQKPVHTSPSCGPQELSSESTRGASAGQHQASLSARCPECDDSPEGHDNGRESTTASGGFNSEQKVYSPSVCTNGSVAALPYPHVAVPRVGVAEKVSKIDHYPITPSVKISNVGEPEGIQNYAEGSPRCNIEELIQNAVEDEQTVLNPSHVIGGTVGMDSVKRSRRSKTDDSGSTCDKHGNSVSVPSNDCSGVYFVKKEREDAQQISSLSGEVSTTTLQKGKSEEAYSAVAVKSKKGAKKLARKKCKSKLKHGSALPSTKKTRTDHKEELQKTRSRLQHKFSGAPMKKTVGYAAVVKPKPSPHNVQKRANGERKGTSVEERTLKSSTKR